LYNLKESPSAFNLKPLTGHFKDELVLKGIVPLDLIGGLWHGALRAARVLCDTNNDVAVLATVPIPDLKFFRHKRKLLL